MNHKWKRIRTQGGKAKENRAVEPGLSSVGWDAVTSRSGAGCARGYPVLILAGPVSWCALRHTAESQESEDADTGGRSTRCAKVSNLAQQVEYFVYVYDRGSHTKVKHGSVGLVCAELLIKKLHSLECGPTIARLPRTHGALAAKEVCTSRVYPGLAFVLAGHL